MSSTRTISTWLALTLAAGSAYGGIPSHSHVDSPDHFIASAARVERAPRLDGTLDDPLWEAAAPVTGLRQRDPKEGEPATEKTEVRVLYTTSAVFFGVTCFDSHPEKIVATELRRDVSQDLDDHFEILIDSNNDGRDAYVFQVNPLGTQMDGLIVEEQGAQNGGDFDNGWDGVWVSSARINKDGWTATIEIPFSTLNFMQSKDVVWGVNFKRFIRSKNEEDLWAAYRRSFGITKVSEEGKLRGITEIGSGRLFVVKPYLLGGVDRVTGQGTKMLHTGGLDIKYGLRSNLILNLTGNTDFADTDVDQQQFNLTPFKIFLPEKRPFFLENSGIFDFSTGGQDQMFFSRQIGIDPNTGEVVPVNFGAKLTGNFDKWKVGMMDVETRSSGPNPYANYGVIRLKRSLFGNSYIGAMGIDKRSGNRADYYNDSAGVDMRLVFLQNLRFFIWAAATKSPGLHGNNTDSGVVMNYDSSWFHTFDAADKIAQNYNPEVGFLPHPDVKEILPNITLTPHPRIRNVRDLELNVLYYRAINHNGQFAIQNLIDTFKVNFNNGSYISVDPWDGNVQRITTPFNIYKDVFIPVGIYRFANRTLAYGSPLDRRITYSGFDNYGQFYGGHLNTAFIEGNFRPTPRFSVSLSETWNRFRLPERNFDVQLAGLQTNYSFSRFVSFTSLIQLDTSNNQAVSANLRLRYNYRPDSDLYIIYNAGTLFQSLNNANAQQLRENRFAVKFTYSFEPHLGKRRELKPEETSPTNDATGALAGFCSQMTLADLAAAPAKRALCAR